MYGELHGAHHETHDLEGLCSGELQNEAHPKDEFEGFWTALGHLSLRFGREVLRHLLREIDLDLVVGLSEGVLIEQYILERFVRCKLDAEAVRAVNE